MFLAGVSANLTSDSGAATVRRRVMSLGDSSRRGGSGNARTWPLIAFTGGWRRRRRRRLREESPTLGAVSKVGHGS